MPCAIGYGHLGVASSFYRPFTSISGHDLALSKSPEPSDPNWHLRLQLAPGPAHPPRLSDLHPAPCTCAPCHSSTGTPFFFCFFVWNLPLSSHFSPKKKTKLRAFSVIPTRLRFFTAALARVARLVACRASGQTGPVGNFFGDQSCAKWLGMVRS